MVFVFNLLFKNLNQKKTHRHSCLISLCPSIFLLFAVYSLVHFSIRIYFVMATLISRVTNYKEDKLQLQEKFLTNYGTTNHDPM